MAAALQLQPNDQQIDEAASIETGLAETLRRFPVWVTSQSPAAHAAGGGLPDVRQHRR